MQRFLYRILYIFWQISSDGLKSNNSIASRLRKKMYKNICNMDANVFIDNIDNVKAGKKSTLHHACYIANNYGKFSMGDNTHLGPFCFVNVYHGNVTIGNDVAIGPGTKIIAYSHHYKKGEKVTNVKITKDIVIKNNVFIGANCTILPGTIINDNVVVGSNSLIKGELESNTVYVGIPCRKIKSGWY
jgi:acetyltransferase-like isoleucine patch superfamily enzyme